MILANTKWLLIMSSVMTVNLVFAIPQENISANMQTHDTRKRIELPAGSQMIAGNLNVLKGARSGKVRASSQALTSPLKHRVAT